MSEKKLEIKTSKEIAMGFAPVISNIKQLEDEKWVSVESLKQLLRKEREKYRQIENSTATDLWREGARWSIRLVDELLGLLESES